MFEFIFEHKHCHMTVSVEAQTKEAAMKQGGLNKNFWTVMSEEKIY